MLGGGGPRGKVRKSSVAARAPFTPAVAAAVGRALPGSRGQGHTGPMDAPPPFPVLVTPRLLLREITHEDAPTLLAIHGDAAHMRWFGADPPTDLAAAHALVDQFAAWRRMAAPGTRWGLQAHDDPTLLGSVGLFGWNRGWRKCSLGYELAAWAGGQGLMGEALQAVIDHGFATLDLHRIEAQVHPDNARSLRLLDRLGFVVEGRLREVARWGGRQHDLLMLSLLRAQWPPRPAAAQPSARPMARVRSASV